MSRASAWLRLLRVANGPTAVADVWMGAALATGELEPTFDLALLSLASLCLYHAGMVLNDASDAEQDARERPERPIPAGLVSRTSACRAGSALLTIGVTIGGIVSWRIESPAPIGFAGAIAVGVIAYNSPLKRSFLGPMLMGACRAMNGLLGTGLAFSPGVAFAVGPGLFAYVAGLTWFARDEASVNLRRGLATGMLASLAGIAWLATAPEWLVTLESIAPPAARWLIWGCFIWMIGGGFVTALRRPSPRTVQRAVVIALQGIIVLDAVLATLHSGPTAGLAILALLPLSMLLRRLAPMT